MEPTTSDVSTMFKQDNVSQYQRKLEVETLNKSLKKNGREPVKNLGKDEFLKLLITELKHQDPTNPMNDREFISQMSQFSSLEQMLNLNNQLGNLISNLSFNSSFNLLGKGVEIDTGVVDSMGNTRIVNGIVESVRKVEGDVLVTINGESYSSSLITKVE